MIMGSSSSNHLRDSVVVIDQVRELSSLSTEQAVAWYQTASLIDLGGETAESLVAQGKVEVVLRYLINLSAGATG